MRAMLGEAHADRRQLRDLLATKPATRPLLLSRELSAARAAHIREVIDDLIHLIRRLQLTTSATVSGLPTLLATLPLAPRELLSLLARLRPPLLTRFRWILRRRPGTRTRILPSLLLQPLQAILVLRKAPREIKNELNTRLTPRVIDRLSLSTVHDCKIRCSNKESLPKAPTTERLQKTPDYRGFCGKRLKGLEPSTFCMASRRSSQLSYSRAGAPSIASAG
jgi:hypothetical protein